LDLFVSQIDALLDHLGIRDSKINIIGFSLGGAVTVGYAARYPQKIDKLVLISPAGFVPISKQQHRRQGPRAGDDTESIISSDQPELHGISSQVKLIKFIPSCILNPIARKVFKSAFSKVPHGVNEEQQVPTVAPTATTESELQLNRLMWQTFVKKGTIEATMSIVKNFPLFNMEKEYSKVGDSVVGKERRVLLIWGADDRVNPEKRTSDKVQKYFKNSFLLSVPDSGHVVINEQPTIVISSIVSFLQQPEEDIRR
jgi:pimeloyl-ACP methyl ester carboxylesterase